MKTREELKEKIIKALHRSGPNILQPNTSDLQNLYQFILNPIEFQIIDVYEQTPIDVDLYNTLKEKYPEEFI